MYQKKKMRKEKNVNKQEEVSDSKMNIKDIKSKKSEGEKNAN